MQYLFVHSFFFFGMAATVIKAKILLHFGEGAPEKKRGGGGGDVVIDSPKTPPSHPRENPVI